MSTLGIINGCIDAPDMIWSEVEFAYNNTYGLHAVSKEHYEWSQKEFHKPGGALDEINKCREAARNTDPHDHGDVDKTNKLCAAVSEYALNISDYLFVKAGRGARFDITVSRGLNLAIVRNFAC